MRGATVIYVSSIDWTFNWQQPQEVASHFSECGNRVLFIENTGVRRPQLRDASRLLTRLKRWWRSAGEAKPVVEGLDVLSPLLLPFPYSRVARRFNSTMLLRHIARWTRRRDGGPLIVFTFLPTPLVHAIIQDLDPTLVIYYCIDLLSESSPGARKLRGPEEKLIAEADLVLTTSEILRSMALQHTSRVETILCGVRCQEFEQAKATRTERPSLFARLAGLVIGFVGTLRKEIDLALLAAAAELAPELNFVLVGPVMTGVRRLAAQPNVQLVGPVPHSEVARYMACFHVGVLPYVQSPFTAAIMPAKLKEYLAAGLPIVATPLPEVRRFAAEHPEVITFANDADEFVTALRTAAADNGPAAEMRRMSIARQYDWSAQLLRIDELLERALTAKADANPDQSGTRSRSQNATSPRSSGFPLGSRRHASADGPLSRVDIDTLLDNK